MNVASWPRNPHAFSVLFNLLLWGCASGDSAISAQIEALLKANPSAPVNLAQIGPSSWERVCVLTPYTNNERAQQVLGVKWDAESRTSIAANDGINVLVFIQDQEIVAYTEYPRGKGDFSKLQPPCLLREQAVVVREQTSDGWLYLTIAR